MRRLITIIYKDESLAGSSGVDEFSEIFSLLRGNAKNWRSPTLAIANRRLWKSPDEQRYIFSLSPSDAAIVSSEIEFENLIPPPRLETKKRLLPTGPNHSAVVLMAVVHGFSILLGSDLQEIGDPRTGWAIIANSPHRPAGKSSFFKIPHHGSQNGHKKSCGQAC